MFTRVSACALLIVLGSCCVAARMNVTSCQYGDMEANCDYKKQKTFDYMNFVQTWGGYFCADGCCRAPATSSGFHLGFGVHGMWPEYLDNDYPSCCTSNFTRKMIDRTLENNPEIRKQLDEYWPALKKCRFVRYETEKHGTCAAAAYGQSEASLVNYWTAVVNLRKRWDFERALATAGITPSKSTMYSLKTIRNVLKSTVGHTINVICDSGNIIEEVRVCVQRPTDVTTMVNPVPFDCPIIDNSCNDKVLLLPVPSIPTTGGCTVN